MNPNIFQGAVPCTYQLSSSSESRIHWKPLLEHIKNPKERAVLSSERNNNVQYIFLWPDTTRAPKGYEESGREYYFTSREIFDNMMYNNKYDSLRE